MRWRFRVGEVMAAAAALAACTAPDRDPAAGRGAPSAASAGTGGPAAGGVELELRLSLKGTAEVRAGAAIPLEVALVNRSRSVRYWLGGWPAPPVAFCTAQMQDAGGAWVDVPRTPVDDHCGPDPLSWTTPVNPIDPGATWVFEEEFAVTTARCSGLPGKFIGFQFPRPGLARIVAHYRHPGQRPGDHGFGAPHLPPFELASEPVEVRVIQ